MNLTLIGHDYKYAVEQIMLMHYPGERPVYGVDDEAGLSARIRLAYGKRFVTATTRISSEGAHFSGSARVGRDKLTDKLVTDRLLQKVVKLSFYKAATAANGVNNPDGVKPVWGALTGIRPAKIASGLLERGVSPRRALRLLQSDYFVSPERAALCIDAAKASLQVKAALSDRDIALYVGIPFCPTRCHYCSFVSHSVEKSIKLIEPFLSCLEKEIDALAPLVSSLGLNVIAVYIGGGTPTTLSAEQLEGLMSKLQSSFDFSALREYTVEAGRPDTITQGKLDAIRLHGADRISINPQSMSDDVLRAIGRRHTAENVTQTVELARQTGFASVNMDLIAGLPGDTPDGFNGSLEQVLTMRPENITIHTLSLKKGSKISLEGTATPGGEEVSKMLDFAQNRLRSSGYVPYYLYRQKFMSGGFENIGWCRDGNPSLYNILIMEELTTILALGGGGVTKLVSGGSGRIERIFNLKYPYEYIENIDRVLDQKMRITTFCSEQKPLPG